MVGLKEEGRETWEGEERVREVEAVVDWMRERVVGVEAEAIVGVEECVISCKVD